MSKLQVIEDKEKSVVYALETPYSTDEIRVGNWEDGKPLYRRTFKGLVGTNTTHNIPHGISNVDKIMLSSNSYFRNSNDDGVFWPVNFFTGNDNYINNCRVSRTNLTFKVGTYISSTANAYYYITVEYTKTTD